jgi:hypothetical protein
MEINVNQYRYDRDKISCWVMEICKTYEIDFVSVRSCEVKFGGWNDCYRTITIVYSEVKNYADIVITKVISEYVDA